MTPTQPPAQAGDEPMLLPEFIVRKVEQAIHSATHPTGMHTNGPAMARVEASQLARLLAVAKSVSLRATADVERVTITPALRRAVDMTRADLGESGSNYPAVRELLAFAESHIATTKPGT